MRHQVGVRKLGKTPSHRRAMLRNMVTSLFRHERIRTTAPKAKEARRFAERMITFGKRAASAKEPKDALHARRLAARFINDETVLKKLFDEIAPKFAERNGGYTRVIRTGLRKGDAAEMAILELVTDGTARKKVANRKTRERLAELKLDVEARGDKGRGGKRRGGAKPAAAKAVAEDVPDTAAEEG